MNFLKIGPNILGVYAKQTEREAFLQDRVPEIQQTFLEFKTPKILSKLANHFS